MVSDELRKVFAEEAKRLESVLNPLKNLVSQPQSIRELLGARPVIPELSTTSSVEFQRTLAEIANRNSACAHFAAMRERIPAITAPSVAVQEAVALQETLAQIAKRNRALLEPLGKQFELQARSIASLIDSVPRLDRAGLSVVLAQINELSSSLGRPHIEPVGTHGWRIDDVSVEVEATNDAIDDFVSSLHSDPPGAFELIVARLRSVADQLAPPLRAIFLRVLVPFMVGLLVHFAAPQIDALVRRETRDVVREVPKATSGADKIPLASYRVVSAQTLNVRQRPSRSAAILDRLPLGSVVKVVSKKDRWSYIELPQSGDAVPGSRGGWVFTRYLKPLRR